MMFLIGLALTGIALPVAIYMFSMLEKVSNNPYTYYFTNGLTEDTVGLIAILASIVAIIGVCLMIFGWINRKNNSALKSLENHTKEKYCPTCKINTTSGNNRCPVCNNELKER